MDKKRGYRKRADLINSNIVGKPVNFLLAWFFLPRGPINKYKVADALKERGEEELVLEKT